MGNGAGKVRCLGRCWARNARLREPWHFSETTQEGRSALPFVVSPDAQPRAPGHGPGPGRESEEEPTTAACASEDQISSAPRASRRSLPGHLTHCMAHLGGGRPTGPGLATPRVGIERGRSQWPVVWLGPRATAPGWCYGAQYAVVRMVLACCGRIVETRTLACLVRDLMG